MLVPVGPGATPPRVGALAMPPLCGAPVAGDAPKGQRQALLDFFAGLLRTSGASSASFEPLVVESK